MHVLIQYFVLLLMCGCTVYSQVAEGSSCNTPIGQSGTCLSIYNCKIFLNLIRKPSGITQEERDYLRRSSCGFIGSTPYVCCPQQDTRTIHTIDPVDEKTVNNEYSFLLPPQCGISNASFPRVVGGVPAKLGEFPFLVALGYRNANNPNQPKWLCGGTLITYRHVLTAAHCVANRRDLYIARVGELDLYDDADGANPTDIPIAKTKIHENYSATKFINDIAILTLARSIEDLNSAWPVCLPWEREKQTMSYVGKQPFVAGWGSIYFNGPSSSILQYATIPVIDNSKCEVAYRNKSIIDDTILCAGHAQGEKDACKGDSGGPLMHGVINRAEKRIEFFQIGVVSYGFRCAEPQFPGVYTRVTMAATTVQQQNVTDFLSKKQKESSKDLVTEWATLEELHNKKLWHQITLKILVLIKKPDLQKGDNLIQLYNNFIQTFENKINPLSLVEIIAIVIEQFKDPKEAVAFLEKTEPKVKINPDAQNLCKVLAGQIYLEKIHDLDATKKIIEEVEATLDNADGVTAVHGRFYLLASQYYRLQGDHAQYYRTALRYLGCIDLDTLTEETKMQHAFFLGLAALLGEGVYNLGELLAHPVLQSLQNTENGWLVDLLYAFNSGDINKFEQMKPKWSAIADLAAQELFLRQKISLLCLMEMTFKRPSHDRQLTFAEIAKETKLPVNEIELLVMKALSQGLVKGAIDQVASTVNMTWVQPRVLDRSQIATMVTRLNEWCGHVATMEKLLEGRANEILTL